MKKFTKTLFLCAGIVSSINVYAENEITIIGNVLDSTCTLTTTGATGNTNSETGDFTIALPNILMCAEITGHFYLGNSRQPSCKSLLPFDLVS